MRRARGASLAELVLAAGVLAFGLVPVVASIQSTAREARFLEFRSQAIARARGLLSVAEVMGPRAFAKALADGTEATLPITLPGGPQTAAGTSVEAVTEKIGYVDEKVQVREAAASGRARLYVLTAQVHWVHPAEPNRPQEVKLVTLQGDALASMNQPEAP